MVDLWARLLWMQRMTVSLWENNSALRSGASFHRGCVAQ